MLREVVRVNIGSRESNPQSDGSESFLQSEGQQWLNWKNYQEPNKWIKVDICLLLGYFMMLEIQT